MFHIFTEDKALKNENKVQNGNKNKVGGEGINQNESIDRIGKLYDVDPNNSNKNPGVSINHFIEQNQNQILKTINSIPLQPASKHNNVHGVANDPQMNTTTPTVLLGGGPQIKNKVCVVYLKIIDRIACFIYIYIYIYIYYALFELFFA